MVRRQGVISADTVATDSRAPVRGGFRLTGVWKRFGDLQVLADVTMTAEPGEVHALVGENGAGKTTLMRILAGLERADAGAIHVAGTSLSHPSPREAQEAGVGLVPQHCEVVPGISVLENLALGWERSRMGVLRQTETRTTADQIAGRLGFAFEWNAPAESLGLGERQQLELLKVLWHDSSVLVFDEPTAMMAAAEVRDLFGVVRRLTAEGRTVVFITHKLDEVRQVADDVTVLRRGKVVGRVPKVDVDVRELARLMIGEVMGTAVRAPAERPGEVRLRLRGVCTTALGGGDRPLRRIDLDTRAGEIVGIAGIDGNGQTELYEVILGLRRVLSGSVELDDRPLAGRSVAQRRTLGIASIPPDRVHEGVDSVATLWENVAAARIAGRRATRWGVIDRRDLRERAQRELARAGVRSGIDQTVGALSGGNIQRLVVARELDEDPNVLIAVHPTRGVDVRGTAFIHEQLLELRARGCAILAVSADLEELSLLADRVAVMHGGRIVGEYVPGEADAADIGMLMSGAVPSGTRR